MDPLSVTASIVTLIELCSRVTDYIASAKDAKRDRIRLKGEIRSCQELLEALKEEVDDSATGNDWQDTMAALSGDDAPLSILGETLKVLSLKLAPRRKLQAAAKAMMWPFEEKDVSKILAIIERQKLSISLALENNNR